MSDKQIPKIINYCWFGDKPLPELAQKCIASWKKFCPDYEIKEWNESNYDVTKNNYMKTAFENKQWAFVSDYARLDIIYEYGGIYFDTDVELVRPLDDLLNLKGFMGIENEKALTGEKFCNTGLGFGAIPKLPIIKEFRDNYEHINFIKEDGSFNQTVCSVFQTSILLKKGLKFDNSIQEIDGLTIFPAEYFAPKEFFSGKINLTANTYSIHHFDASWVDVDKDKGAGIMRKDRLDKLSIVLAPEEEKILYTDILYNDFDIKTKQDLYIAVAIMEKIFSAGNKYFENGNLYQTIRSSIFRLSEASINNKVPSLKLYFTTFRKWKIFDTQRANLRYIYHCLRNLIHV
ncbi:glycosyl transferase [bacterium]|nr:glycosyl transferase [bacterium]